MFTKAYLFRVTRMVISLCFRFIKRRRSPLEFVTRVLISCDAPTNKTLTPRACSLIHQGPIMLLFSSGNPIDIFSLVELHTSHKDEPGRYKQKRFLSNIYSLRKRVILDLILIYKTLHIHHA